MARLATVLTITALLLLVSLSAATPDPVAPKQFKVEFVTTKGTALVKVVREWSPFGVDRFYNLVKHRYYDNNGIFRVIRNPTPFVAQWGISGTPAISTEWNATIPNDPVVKSNTRGFISYAANMDSNNKACCRTTQIYVNYADNSRLDKVGFSPFAFVEEGMEHLDKLYSDYGELVDQDQLYSQGNSYLKAYFPKLDYMVRMVLVEHSQVW
jgi:peptidyl-prolyl cis-trans isomerase A (cyclophilin A)